MKRLKHGVNDSFSLSMLTALGASLAAGVMCETAVAAEQIQLEEIVVTAEHRTEDIQKTAASVSVRSGEDLTAQGRFSLEAILQDVPGVVGGAATAPGFAQTSGTDNIAAGITIRGIQSNLPGGGNLTATPTSVAMYVDDVYSGAGGDFDLSRVEVLRGPQGTLYGRSATAGVVAIHTHDPDLGKFDGFATVEVGNYKLRHYTAAVNVPMGETFAVRVSGNSYERNGYISPDGGALRVQEGRIKLLWKPNDALTVLLGFVDDYNLTYLGGTDSNGTNGNIPLIAPNTYGHLTDSPPLGTGHNRYVQSWANVTWDFGPAVMTYIPAVRSWDSFSLAHTRGVLNFDQTASTPEDNFITHELRFASKPGSKLTWQAGALYYDNNLSNSNAIIDYPSGAPNLITDVSRNTTAMGLFSEATYALTNAWRVTAGVRYDDTRVETSQTAKSNQNPNIPPGYGYPVDFAVVTVGGAPGKRTFTDWTYKLRLEHDLTPSNMVYASVSTGASPGDVQISNSVPSPVVDYLKPETLTAYELGSKNRFFNDILQINGNVFYEDYGGYQTAAIDVLPFPFFSFPVLQVPVQSYGAELELLAQLTGTSRLGFNLGWTHAAFVHKDTPVPGTTNTFGTYNGQDAVPGVVPLQAQLSYDQDFYLPLDSKLSFHIDGRWLSPHYEGAVSAEQLATAPDYFNSYAKTHSEYIADVSATWKISHFSLTGYVRNVTDNRYKTNVDVSGIFGYIGATPYDPRTEGVIFSVNW